MERTRVRLRLCYTPKWEGPIKKWTVKFASKNIWRCRGQREELINDVDDIIQDGYLKFTEIKERYPRVNNPAHFMSLYTAAVGNQMHDRARLLHKRRRVIHNVVIDQALSDYNQHIGEITNQGYLNALLAEAPEELKLALAVFDSNPNSLVGERPRESLNVKLRRILCMKGRGKQFDFTGVLLGILKGA